VHLGFLQYFRFIQPRAAFYGLDLIFERKEEVEALLLFYLPVLQLA
jgi:hypothetical protein